MAKERLSMRKIKEILRLKYECALTNRQIADSCSTARSTIAEYLTRARSAGLTWPVPEHLSDTELEHLLFSGGYRNILTKREMPPMEYIHQELKKKGVTLHLLWYEYKKDNPDGYQYSYFCDLLRISQTKSEINFFSIPAISNVIRLDNMIGNHNKKWTFEKCDIFQLYVTNPDFSFNFGRISVIKQFLLFSINLGYYLHHLHHLLK